MKQTAFRTIALATSLVGCNAILGIESDYRRGVTQQDPQSVEGGVRDSGGGGFSGSSSGAGGSGGKSGGADAGTGGQGVGGTAGAGPIGTFGQSCAPEGAYACTGNAERSRLQCTGGKWASAGECDAGGYCDTTTPGSVGFCNPVVAECAGKAPGTAVCKRQDVETCGPDLVTVTVTETCSGQACVNGGCAGSCAPKAIRCNGLQPQTCDADGSWADQGNVCASICDETTSSCAGVCVPTSNQCDPTPGANGMQVCGPSGTWSATNNCTNQTCVAGSCGGSCAPKQTQCDPTAGANGTQTCTATGGWGLTAPCSNQTCTGGKCQGTCAPGQKRCDPVGNGVQTCDPTTGNWAPMVACPISTPYCSAAVCTAPPSCQGLASVCGPNGTDACCRSQLVMGGTYFRSYDGASSCCTSQANPATVSDFRLDKFEVTVGRFRKFVAEWNGGWRPASGAGKHRHLNSGSGLANSSGTSTYEPGWNTSWASSVAPTDTNLQCNANLQTWTGNVSTGEARPIVCETWHEAYAFCIWDGGFLPSEAEWNYAAGGGDEQRVYPWSSPPNSTTVDCTYANYSGCYTTPPYNYFFPVGVTPKGNGRYGQSDLLGNVFEWNLDWYNATYVSSCTNCAYLPASTGGRVHRGGSGAALLQSGIVGSRDSNAPTARAPDGGFRCARSP